MRNRRISCWLVCLGLYFVSPTDAWPQAPPTAGRSEKQAPQPPEKIATRLVEQLGSDQFSVRERATEQLILLGLPAVPNLERAIRSNNREIRQRSQLVLSVIHELDFKNRLKAFEKNEDGDNSYGLPGWERYRDLVGNSAISRKLFVEMHQAERELLGAESQLAEDAAGLLQQRCQRLRYSVQIFGTRHELPPIVAALFVATNEKIPLGKSTNAALMNLCQQVAFENAIASTGHRPILQKILAAWILREDAVPAHELLVLALHHNIEQSLPRVRTLAKRAGDADLYDRHFAVLCLAKFGGIDDVATLEPLLADKTVITRYRLNNMTYSVQLRDLVLAALLTLGQRDPAEFGYGRLRMQEPFVFDNQSLGFARDEDRQVALGKWQLYRMRADGQ